MPDEVAVNAKTLLLTAGLATLLGAGLPAQAQRASSTGEVQRLIDQLNPGSGTRGIRLPADGAASSPSGPPSGQPSGPPAAAGQDRVAAPTAKPAQPRTAPPATTAPAGVPSASITVLFPSGSAALTPEAARSIDPLGQALTSAALAPYRFRIEGHTDTVGSRESNQLLSEARALAVRNYLVQRYGVQPDRLEAIGLGEDQPLVATGDEMAERRNRRVQILNLGT
jgi:outer membrane protein OmpA-like peptidoglycan-associated protein